MKWLFLLGMIAMLPILPGYLRTNPKALGYAAMAVGFLPFVLDPWNLYVAPVSWGAWPGYAKGIEVGLLDLAAASILLSGRGRALKARLTWPWMLYLVTIAFSIPLAGVPMAAAFYLWQLLRMYMLFCAVVRLGAVEGAYDKLILGWVLGIALEVYYVLDQTLAGAPQPNGTFASANLLGMATNLVALPVFALLLASKRRWYAKAGPVGGIIVAVMTASRATIGLAGIGYVLLLILSGIRAWTSRKAMITGLVALGAVLAVPAAMKSIDRRSEGNVTSRSDEERAAFKRAAHAIIADYPFGVGANQYVVVANTQGYSARAGVAWNSSSRATSVHDTYLLTRAELGLPGLFALIVLLAAPVAQALRCAFRYRKDPRGELLVGLSAGLIMLSAHLLFEWVFVMFHVQYVLAMIIGMIVGLTQRVQGDVRRRKPSKPAEAPDAVETAPSWA